MHRLPFSLSQPLVPLDSEMLDSELLNSELLDDPKPQGRIAFHVSPSALVPKAPTRITGPNNNFLIADTTDPRQPANPQ
jgi:hypothetical protein